MEDSIIDNLDFVNICHRLELLYKDDFILQSNGTKLLGIPEKRPPLAKHILYKGLNSEQIMFLKQSYKGIFPQSLIEFYKAYNGGSFFRTEECARFEIFGFRFTQYNGDLNNLEPGNISVMDLGRHRKIPKHWMKCAWYYTPEETEPWEIFIDTKTEKVYSYLHLTNNKNNEWDSLSSCFCEIYNYYIDTF